MHNNPSVAVNSANSQEWDSAYRGRSVAVVGAGGFIGRWVAAFLSARGARLHLAVRSRASAKPILAQHNISGEVYEVDLLDNRRIHSFIDKVRPAIMFNLAGYSVDRRELDPWLAQQINTELPAVLGQP